MARHDNRISLVPPSTPAGRSTNERAILSLIRRHGAMASAELARRSGLSAQTASVLTRALEADGLLTRGEPQRGKVGKPLVPMSLNPSGAFSLGLRIGRRSADLVLVDLAGSVMTHRQTRYGHPTPDAISAFAEGSMGDVLAGLPPDRRDRIAGLGVATPYEIWNWLDGTGAPKDEMMAWRRFSFEADFDRFFPYPVLVGNDASLACKGEHAFGGSAGLSDFAYFYVGTFIGGGLVLSGQLYSGAAGNAAAFGSLPVRRADGSWAQLMEVASIYELEARLQARDPAAADRFRATNDWSLLGDLAGTWLSETVETLARAAITATAVLDVPVIVLDGTVPEDVRARLVERIGAEIARIDTRGIRVPTIRAGTLGAMAGALGAADQPIVARYFVE